MVGQLLDGRYQIIRALGKGAFGKTYLAQDTQYPGNPYCVVKHLQPDDPKILEKAKQLFSREAEILAKLGKHDQIPELKAYSAKQFYLVQEYIDGYPLRNEISPSGRRWTENQVIFLLQDVLSILVFIHDEGVIHRDIKPDNIMRRRRDNKLVLIDFGAIKEVLNTPGVNGSTVAGSKIYTLGYAPIEQLLGKPRPNSDIYALGAIALEALTGEPSHLLPQDDNTDEIIWQNKASVSPALTAIITQMVRHRHQDRYQSAAEVLQALQQLVQTSQAQTVIGGLVNQLVLEWVEAGQVKQQTIREGQISKNPGTVRIGRDPAQCDIIFTDLTVSGLHVEIFFHQQQKHFYLRNLRQTNPPIVDGRPLPTGEIPLSQGSNLQLGQINIRVAAITLGQTSGVAPTQLGINTQPAAVGTAYESEAAPGVAPTENSAANNHQPTNYATSKRTQIKLDCSVLGIDLGTTKSLIAGLSDGQPVVLDNAEGLHLIPSVVAYNKNGELLIGQSARRQAVTNPDNTFYSIMHFVGRDYDEVATELKRFTFRVLHDTNGQIKIDCPISGKLLTPEAILAEILRKLVEDASFHLGQPVTQVVLTVPNAFNYFQRQALKQVAKLAGLEVLRLVKQTSIAAIAYGIEKKTNETIFIFDLGGGNCNTAVLEIGDGVFEVLSASGDSRLGGEDFNHKIVEWLLEEFQRLEDIDLRQDRQALLRLYEAAEIAKIELSNLTQTEINLPFITTAATGGKHLNLTITRSQFEKFSSDLIDRCRLLVENSLRSAKLHKDDINEIILVGGSTRIPAVRNFLHLFFNKEPNQKVNANELVALGASLQAGTFGGSVTGILILDVLYQSVGVETIGGAMTKIVHHNTTIPTKKSDIFTTAVDNQDYVEIHILEGEQEFAQDNKTLGILRLDIPPAPKGTPQIEVIVDIDANEVISVTVKDKDSGKKQSISITGNYILSKQYVKRLSGKYKGMLIPYEASAKNKEQQELSYDTAIDVPLSSADLQNGTQVKITFEDGQSINVNVPANAKYGQTLRVRSKGNLNPKDQKRGNLYIRLIQPQYIYHNAGVKEFTQVGLDCGITKQSLGVQIEGGIMEIIIPRNTTVPINKSEIFSTTVDNQDSVKINIVQGEQSDRKSLGVLQLYGIHPAPKALSKIEVIFEINPYGFLSVSAWDKTTQT